MSGRECPTGCGRSVRPGKLMCGRCWSVVPVKLQVDIYRTWKALQKAQRVSMVDDFARAARRAYSRAVEAAVEAVYR